VEPDDAIVPRGTVPVPDLADLGIQLSGDCAIVAGLLLERLGHQPGR
jgi:CBS domain containing-hemolysin-like protein